MGPSSTPGTIIIEIGFCVHNTARKQIATREEEVMIFWNRYANYDMDKGEARNFF